MVDFSARFAVNLMGGPAMKPPEFAKWKQKVLLGASLRVIAPIGQYDPTKIVNWGHQSLGFQAGIRLLRTLGKLGARRLRRGMVLHDE
jgi:hypothetical protein